MGYTGRILVARTGTSPAVDAEVLHERDLGGGWWSVQLDGDAPGALKALVAATGAPVVWAFVLDSDCADVEGLTPSGVAWRTYLHPDTAESYGAPALEQSEEEITQRALAWSAEAGLTADRDALHDAFEATNVFAEDTLDELLGALGIPGLVGPDAAKGAG